MKPMTLFLGFPTLMLGFMTITEAGQIPDRETLDSILGSGGVTEELESLVVDDGLCMIVPSPLNSDTIIDEQGPGLVVDGVWFVSVGQVEWLSWCGIDAFANLTKCLLPPPSHSLEIDFADPVRACGLDFFQTIGGKVAVSVFASDDASLLDSFQVSTIPDTYVFFGYEETDGIGKLRYGPIGAYDSIACDNVTFGIPGSIPGDLNDDGFVGGDDLDIVRSYWGQEVTAGNKLHGDPSGDGFVGGDDLDEVRAHWGEGTPPMAEVPEPSTVFLLLFGAATMIALKRSRDF